MDDKICICKGENKEVEEIDPDAQDCDASVCTIKWIEKRVQNFNSKVCICDDEADNSHNDDASNDSSCTHSSKYSVNDCDDPVLVLFFSSLTGFWYRILF